MNFEQLRKEFLEEVEGYVLTDVIFVKRDGEAFMEYVLSNPQIPNAPKIFLEGRRLTYDTRSHV